MGIVVSNPAKSAASPRSDACVLARPILEMNSVNIEPALQATSTGSASQEDWRANPNESLTAGRV